MIGFVLGRILLIEAALLSVCLGVALLYGEAAMPFLVPIALLVALGCALSLRTPKDTTIYAREGFVVVALCWVVMSAFGALPFWLSGQVPSYIDCFFETVSGFTTTGSSILPDVEALDKGLLFWRSFTHWVGGMGVLVFAMMVLPMTDGRSMHIMRAEVPGPTVGKVSSKLRDTSKTLYKIYAVMTLVEVVLLCAGGMPLYDALINSFGSAGTGGFSHLAKSIGTYENPYFDWVIGIFITLFGINFNLYYFILIGRAREALRSEEMRVYLGVIAVSTVAITVNILHMYESVGTSLRHAFFQVASVITTTGYATVDFNLWPAFSKTLLVLLMFFGGCAGSTAGGLKMARIVILVKASLRDLQRMLHPHAVTTVRFEEKPLEDKTVRSTQVYLSSFLVLFAVTVLLISLDGFDLVTTFTAVTTCINNIGPGLEVVGPMGGFAPFSAGSKLLLSLVMLAGRLELYPMLVLFSPSTWTRSRRAGRSEGKRFIRTKR